MPDPRGPCCVCAVCCVLYAACYVLCDACCVLCAVCCVMCAACCVLRAVSGADCCLQSDAVPDPRGPTRSGLRPAGQAAAVLGAPVRTGRGGLGSRARRYVSCQDPRCVQPLGCARLPITQHTRSTHTCTRTCTQTCTQTCYARKCVQASQPPIHQPQHASINSTSAGGWGYRCPGPASDLVVDPNV